MWLVYNDCSWGIEHLNICKTKGDAEECALAWVQDYRESYYHATGIIVPYTRSKVKILKIKEY